MSDFSKESVPPIGRDASVGDPKTGESARPTRTVKAWRWVSRGFLTLVLVLGFSELFVFRGAFFRLATPPVKAKAQEPNKGGGESPQQTQQPEFDPSDLNTVPGGQGPVTPLDVSDQRQLALKLQELSDKVEALQARESKLQERANNLGQYEVRDAIWRRVVRGSLQDKDVPQQWCQHAGSRASVDSFTAAMSMVIGYGIAEPLDTVKGRILCGNASTFDASYLTSLENWTKKRSAELDTWHDRLNALSAQLKKEGVLKP